MCPGRVYNRFARDRFQRTFADPKAFSQQAELSSSMLTDACYGFPVNGDSSTFNYFILTPAATDSIPVAHCFTTFNRTGAIVFRSRPELLKPKIRFVRLVDVQRTNIRDRSVHNISNDDRLKRPRIYIYI